MTDLIALVDGSAYSTSVCDHAAWIAGRTDRRVIVAHILGHRQGVKSDLSGNIGLGARTALLEELAELDEARARLAQKRGRAILEDAKARLEADGVRRVETRLRNGDLVETVQGMEADADLILIGKRGEAAETAKLHLGSNVERVVRASTKPVLVCNQAFKPIKRIMVAFDGGPQSLKAVDHVARSKVFAGTDCHLLFVGAETAETRSRIDGAAALLRGGGYNVTTGIAAAPAEDAIPAQITAENIDLLIMAGYRHSRIRSMIVGSTTSEVMRSSPIPFLLLR
ncbi:universal stress protein [Pseudoruegeria sp. SK021]|uniref:universal stress protein n=1 Tax=Pseudoruegeria sp. SK021 TaxID=1933035 RepID=UPI000A229251|nr:universal stress protein [Pseudoruegeria sp. SK021]OSP56799.1 universal stress protein UspA [Pseudoruegeria sp. SK021]